MEVVDGEKEEQKKLLVEMMKEDEKAGMYEEPRFKTLLVERFADNGEFSHYELINNEGEILWNGEQSQEQKEDELRARIKELEKELQETRDEWKKDRDRLQVTNLREELTRKKQNP